MSLSTKRELNYAPLSLLVGIICAQVLTKYANLLSSMTGGGRWIILNLRYLSSENFNEVNAIFGKTILAEEIFENIGGILMSIAVIQYCHYHYYCYDGGNIGFSIFSLLICV